MKLYITVLSGSFVQFSMGFIIHGQFDKLCKVIQNHDDPFISHGNSWGRLTDSHTLAYFGIPSPGGAKFDAGAIAIHVIVWAIQRLERLHHKIAGKKGKPTKTRIIHNSESFT